MDLFTGPSWDDGDACEKINKKLLGSATESTVAASNKKSRKAAKKMAKLERSKSSAANQEDVSVNNTNHVDTLKKDLLSELKCKFAKKRKSDSIDTAEGLTSPPPIKRKKVTFNNEAEVVLIDSTKPVHVSPKKDKKKKKAKKLADTPTDEDVASATLNQPQSKFKLSSLLAKLSKKLDKLDEKELEEKKAKGIVENDSNEQIAKKPNSINGKLKKKKKKLVASNLPEGAIAASEAAPSQIISESPKSTKQKKKNKLSPGNTKNDASTKASPKTPAEKKLALKAKNEASPKTSPKTPAEKKLALKAKKKLKRERKKLKRNGGAQGTESTEPATTPKTSAANNSAVSPVNLSNHNQLKLQKSLALASPSSTPSKQALPEQKIAVRRPNTLRERMMRKLHASRFRYLNEQMYLSKGNESLEYFKTDPQAFHAYHQGYRQQVEQWPLNPLDKIINMLRKKPQLVVADFGCGDARLARSVPNTVHSFDLVALSDAVTACDMAHTPLGNGVVDVAVFCLSLMGTNLDDYIREANRVLKQGGSLKIAEVESRFEDVDTFVKNVQKYGFDFVNKDLSNDLFYFMDFHKVENISSKKGKVAALPPVSLKPCYYKKR